MLLSAEVYYLLPKSADKDNGFGVGDDEWKVLADFGSDHVNHTHAIYNYLIANNLYDQKSNGLIKKHYLIQPLIQRLGVFLPFPFLRYQQGVDLSTQRTQAMFVLWVHTIGQQHHCTLLCGLLSDARSKIVFAVITSFSGHTAR